ncbi:MAG: DUF3341 domain-containing protein [Deltaproteobacteria bacterium]|nr:DUF3341 domain-containing protein [Deltaproteobacteria bacterium]
MKSGGDLHKLLGIVGLFRDPYHLLRGAKEAHKRQFKHCDAFTPYPIHGLDKILRHKKSLIPWITLVAGLTGCAAGFALQIWTSAIDWPLNIGGKPLLSIPAFVPVAFELTILFGGLATAAALFLFCRLPDFHTRILDKDITNNIFALYVPAKEEGFQESEVQQFLKEAGAYEIKMVE